MIPCQPYSHHTNSKNSKRSPTKNLPNLKPEDRSTYPPTILPNQQPTSKAIMQELRTKAEYLKASNADGTVILQATATWCSQCKAIAPAVDKLIAKYPEGTFYKYDTDSAGDIAQELGVSQMPVFTIFHDGDLEDTVRGAKAKALEEAVGKVYKGKVVEE